MKTAERTYRDATFSQEHYDLLGNLYRRMRRDGPTDHKGNLLYPAELAALNEVLTRWETNGATEMVLGDDGLEDS